MNRSILKATTALTLCLSLANPVPVAAQAFALPRPPAIKAAGPERLIPAQTCEEDPTQPDCQTQTDPSTQPEGSGGDAAPPAEGDPAQADAPAAADTEALPGESDPVVTEPADPGAEAAQPAEPTPEPEAAPVEPAPEASAEEATSAIEPQAGEAAPAPEPLADPAQAEPAPAPEAVPAEPAPEAAGEPAAPEETAPSAEPQSEPVQAVPEPAVEAEPAPDAAPAEPAPEAPAPDAAAGAPVQSTPEAGVPQTDPAPSETSAPDGSASAPQPEAAQETASEVPPAEPVVAPTPEQEQVLETLMADPEVAEAVETLSQTVAPSEGAGVAAAAAAAAGADGAPPPVDTSTQTLGAADTRSSAQDFATPLATTAPTVVEEDDDDGLSDLEKAGLVALGAVAVGMLINSNRVVAKSGDRVVVDRGDGNLAIWKDDDAILRTPGVVETTQRYGDGSTLTRLARPDGSEIVTVRDATGRVVRRELLRADGTSVPIIDDTRTYEPVVVSELPRPRVRALDLSAQQDPALWRALLEEAEQADPGRTFSLSQIRDIVQVRELAPELAAGTITFETGSAAIRPEEAGKLARIGEVMRDLIAENPREVFLVEGHTDAVGSAAYNLALSDRRAESIALALSEIFGVPAENMVVQGYGERYLKVRTEAAEPANRRVALRRITWLMEGEA